MKKLIFALFIFTFVFAKAQDNPLLSKPDLSSLLDSGKYYGLYPGKAMNLGVKDTVRVVMLICDTTSTRWVDSAIRNGKLVQIGEWHKGYSTTKAYWQYGYSVRELAGHYNAVTSSYLIYRQEAVYRHIEYLGEDKKPLFNKIVWMAKEVGK